MILFFWWGGEGFAKKIWKTTHFHIYFAVLKNNSPSFLIPWRFGPTHVMDYFSLWSIVMDVCKGKKKKLEKRVWWTRLNSYGGRQVNTSVGVGIRIQFKTRPYLGSILCQKTIGQKMAKKCFLAFSSYQFLFWF